MASNAAPNVWTQMGYVPPRGQCNFKPNIVSSKCPCLRFMLHPLKSASSYECDGCNHHASFHSMENRTEDEIRKRWELEAKEKEDSEAARPRKRPRQIGNGPSGAASVLNELGLGANILQELQSTFAGGKPKAKATRAKRTTAPRSTASRSRATAGASTTEASDGEYMDVVEVD